MFRKTKPTADEEIRMEALELSIETTRGMIPQHTINTAAKFEKYIKEGASDGTTE